MQQHVRQHLRQNLRTVVGNGFAALPLRCRPSLGSARRGLAAGEPRRDPRVLLALGAVSAAGGVVAKTVFDALTKGVQDAATDAATNWWLDPEQRAKYLLERCGVPEIPAEDEEVLVERKELFDRIAEHVLEAVSKKYLVVVGPRGAGKSMAVKKMLRGRGKVVYVNLTSEFATIHSRLRKLLDLPPGAPFELSDVLRQFKDLRGVEKPVLVVELDSNLSAEDIRRQSQEVKVLCIDNKLAHGILVLSDANAIFKLNPDPGRQRVLWVGDLDDKQANAFLDKCGVLQRGDPDLARLRVRLLDETGANPQDLFDTATDAKTAAAKAVKAALPADATESERVAAAKAAERAVFEQFIEKKQSDAFTEVDSLLTQVPIDEVTKQDLRDQRANFRRLILALLENPTGVAPNKVHFSPLTASIGFKPAGFRAVTYNSEIQLFQFYSKAHEHTARRWFENEAKASAKAAAGAASD